jgi:hypothetical protein
MLASCAAAPAQESSPVGEIRPAMMELQKGSWTLDGARNVIETLLKAGHSGAAFWWVTLADDAVKAKKLPANATATLGALRKRCEDLGASAEDKKLVLKLVRHLESLVTAKNLDEAKKVAETAKFLSTLVPDATTCKSLEAAEAKIVKSGNQDPSNLPRQQKQFAEMQEALATLTKARLEKLLDDYEAAGCKPGRVMMKKVIEGAAATLGEEPKKAMLLRLGAAAHALEPTRTLSFCVRPTGTQLYRDGKEAERADKEPVELKVLDGDLIQLTAPEYSAREVDGKRSFHVVLTSARLDGKDLDLKSWFVNKSNDTTLLDPPLIPTGIVRMKPDDPRLTQNFKGKLYEKDGAFVGAVDDSARAVGVNEECVGYEKDFVERKLKPVWVGAVRAECVLVLKIPE